MTDNRFLSGKHMGLEGNPEGAPVFVLSQTTAAGTSSYTVVSEAAFRFKVLDVWAVNAGAGGASDTVKATDGTNDITNALDLNKSDKVVTRAGTIDDAYATIDRGESLKLTTASDAVAEVYLLCVRT